MTPVTDTVTVKHGSSVMDLSVLQAPALLWTALHCLLCDSTLHDCTVLCFSLRTVLYCIVCCVVQPSLRILEQVDQILLLSHGAVVHHGSLMGLERRLELQGLPVPLRMNGLEYAIELLKMRPDDMRVRGHCTIPTHPSMLYSCFSVCMMACRLSTPLSSSRCAPTT